MSVARRVSRLVDWTQRHPAKAATALFLSGVAALVVHAKFTEHDRFKAAFEAAVWEWSQVGENPRPLDPQEREKLIESLFSREAPDRWRAAGILASWREPAALWPLIATMQDGAGTGRTCLISQALGKLADPAAVPALIEAAQHRSNVDLRVCATHSLGQIGDAGAISFLEWRSVDRSASEGDRTVAISALGEIGSVRAMPELPNDQPVAIICGSGYRSSIAGSMLQAKGYEVENVTGGMTAFTEAGNAPERLSTEPS